MTHLHGPVPLDDEFYCERPFELRLVREVMAGRWVLLLGPRQHGKTSALLRLKSKLEQAGIPVAAVDLQKLPPISNYSDLISWFSNRIATELGGQADIAGMNDLSEALQRAVPEGKSPVIVLVDEASNIQDEERRNSFYGQLRAISTERGDVPEGHVARRLRIVFSGTFREERLVAIENSPFNTCERIDTSDLRLEDVSALISKANVDHKEQAAGAIFGEVGGQPYLIQRLIEAAESDDGGESLNIAIEELRTGQSQHIRHLFRRVLEEDSLSNIVSRMVRDGAVAYEPGDDDQRYLIVLGLAKLTNNQLVFRNALYAHIASISPQLSAAHLGDGADQAVIFAYPLSAFSGFTDKRLEEVAFSAQMGAVGAYQAGSNRLALAGFGNALEALLLDFLMKQHPRDITIASAECKIRGGRFNPARPETWMLVDMMRGARKVAGVGGPEIPESLREWRNLVHPSVCLRNYRPDETYRPEVITAVGLFGMVLRDLT